MTRKHLREKRAALEAALSETRQLQARAEQAVREAALKAVQLEAQLALIREFESG